MTKQSDLIKALAVTAELCGAQFSEGAARVFVQDLAGFDPTQILGALKRCRQEVRGRLTVSDVITRLDDGRPGPEQAWARLPVDEGQTVVWTEEMRLAWGTAYPLLREGDRIAGRMAFKEAYAAGVSAARERREPVRWGISLGTDQAGRHGPLIEAVRNGLLPRSTVQDLLPGVDLDTGQPLLPAPGSRARELMGSLKAALAAPGSPPAPSREGEQISGTTT